MTEEARPKVAGKLWAAEKEVGTEYAFIPQMHSDQGRSQRGTVRGRCRVAGASTISKDDTQRNTSSKIKQGQRLEGWGGGGGTVF